ncbi:MAG: pre-peptidase C-terminal domain-containing protein [Myxococcota bacterium]
MSFHKISGLFAAAALLAGCANSSDTTPDGPATDADFRDGSYYYVLGYDPATGKQVRGGTHEVVTYDANGKREAINSANRTSRLHPAMTANSDYLLYDENLRQGGTDWDVFASTWWPQSRNGTAWRWQPGANQDYNDLSDVDRLSPMEKYDLLFYPGQTATVAEVDHCEYRDYVDDPENCETINHPALTVAGPATKWELENQGVYQFVEPENWWGHCNGWASYATAEPLGYPVRDVHVQFDDGQIYECEAGTEGCMLWRMADIEALMTELYFSDQATFSGSRCNTTPDEIERDEHGRPTDPECRDLNPGSFHAAITGMMARGADELVEGMPDIERPAFIIDHNWDHEIWNFPVVAFDVNSTDEVTAEEAQALVGGEGAYQFNAAATRFVRVQLTYQMISDSVPPTELLRRADTRDLDPVDVVLNYVLELDSGDRILGGEWIDDPTVSWGEDSKELHPDFMWKALAPRGWGEGADDLGGDSDNPFVAYSRMQMILRCANDADTCFDDRNGGGGEVVVAQDLTSAVGRNDIERHSDTLAPGTWTFTLSHDPANPGGDADLYVRSGAAPTLAAYDCRPWLNGSAETCTLELTEPTEVHWMVHGYSEDNAFRLQVTGVVDGDGGGGTDPDPWGGLTESGSVTRNEELRFSTGTVPEGRYTFNMSGNGDADLYVRAGSAPSTSTYDCRPYTGGSNESCTVNLTGSGEIHVMVRGYAENSSFELVGAVE